MSISFDVAKKLAENAIDEDLFWVEKEKSLISDYFLEADGCWFFFRKENVDIPAEYAFKDGAYAVSKKGNVRLIATFRRDSEELFEYLRKMSEYFLSHDE